MTTELYARLHPSAFAIAGAVAGLVASLILGVCMFGFGSMMRGGSMMGDGGRMMGAGGWMHGGHMGFAGGLVMLIAFIVLGFITGWIVASVYNAIVGRPAV